jgi:CBS domain-containing protein
VELLKIARRPAVTVPPETTVRQTVALMAKYGVGAIVVTNADQKVLGIFTERDNLLRVTNGELDADKTQISEVMTAPVHTVPPDMGVEQGLAIMIRCRLRHLPIVDAAHHVLAIASLRYLLMRKIGEQQTSLETLAALAGAGGPG